MRVSLVVGSAAACAALVLATSWWFDMPLDKAAVLAPVIVVSFGALAALVVLWTRIALDPLLRKRREQS